MILHLRVKNPKYVERARKGGTATRDKYGSDFYSKINAMRKERKGRPSWNSCPSH